MSFGAPAFLVFLLLVPLLVALYFKKSRPMRKVLPSTKMWDLVLRRLANNSLFHRYRHSLFLALQMTALLALVFGLARPHLSRSLSGRTVVVIDTSASMRAKDVAPSRFEAARAKALALLGRVDSGGEVALVTADSQVLVRAPFGTDLATTIGLVKNVEPTDHPGPDLGEVLATLESLQRQRADRVVVLTDQLPADDIVTRLRSTGVTVHAFGKSGDNAAVTRFEVRPQPVKAEAKPPAPAPSASPAVDAPAPKPSIAPPIGWDAVAQVTSFATGPVKGRLEVLQGGKVIAGQPVTLPKRGDESVRFAGLKLGEGVVEARLTVESGNDHLAADDRAWSGVGRQATSVLLLGRERSAIARVLKTIPGLQVRAVGWQEAGTLASLPAADITVVEDVWHPELAVRSALIFSGTGELGSPSGPLVDGQPVEQPVPTRFESTHPVLKYISFKDITFTQAARLKRGPGDVEVLGASGVPLVLARSRGTLRQVVCAFTTESTDFAMRVSFPIFVMNALRWIGGSRLEGAAGLELGEAYTLPAGMPTASTLTGPDGKPIAWALAPSVPVTATASAEPAAPPAASVEAASSERTIPAAAFRSAGVYVLTAGDRRLAVPAGLSAFGESAIAPAQDQDVLREPKSQPEGAAPVGLARWLIALALAVMIFEWALYARMGG